MHRVIHFDISADRPERAQKFYSNIFGWKFDKWKGGDMDYWMITTGKDGLGINGGMGIKGDSGMMSMNTIGVTSIDDVTRKVTKAGGEVLQDKMPIKGVGWFASFRDPEGNVFGLMQDDRNAK